jgi:4-hydroxy-2-oxoheptanedioate aldolase
VPTQNIVKQAARDGGRIRGIHMTFAAPCVIELLAHDIEFIYLDGEHGCFDAADIEAACVAAELHGVTIIARVPDASSATITRYLDRGMRGVVVPHIETVEQAREAVAAAYFAPLGQRSFGGSRPTFLAIPDRLAHLRACNAATSLCLMIESAAGVEVAGRLAAVDGVDYFSFGMMDLAQALGHPGDPGHADVRAAVEAASKAIRAEGKRIREDFMQYAWINEVILAGSRHLLAA